MSSKYVDTTAAMQVIGAVYLTPQLLDITDKYSISEEDFAEPFHRIVFGSIYKLYELGTKKMSLAAISDFLSARPKYEAIYKENKGDEWLVDVVGNTQSNSFDYYYSRLKKFTLLRAYDAFGIDVSDILDPDNIFDTKKRQEQEERLDNLDLMQIADLVDEKIDRVRAEYVNESTSEAHMAGEGIMDLIERFKLHPEVGVPLYGPLVNTVTRGARLKKFYLRSAPTGVGKAIPNYTLIPTPSGYRKVGDIRPGDFLFGQDGKPTKVVQIHPQAQPKQVWEIEFIDGRVVECCEDHLWEYRYESHRDWAYRVESLREIVARTEKLKNGLKNSNDKGYRFQIKLNQPVQYEAKELPIHPYVMGAILGDGSLRYDATNKSLLFSSGTDELPNLIASLMGEDIKPYKNSDFNFNYCFKRDSNLKHPLWVEEIFSMYPELWNLKSEDKFIPNIYLLGDIEQRISLLQGLLDTDGSIDAVKGRIKFTTVSPLLRDQIIELCHSLGMITSYNIDPRSDKYTTGECYSVHIQCPKADKPKLFRLERKKKIAEAYAANSKRCEYKDHLSIVDIRPTDKYVDMTCFTVDNQDHLFLMNDYIVTHNTRSLVADACYIACDRIYDDAFGWIRNGVKMPTLFITTEQELSEVQTMMLAFLSNVNEEHILNAEYEGDEEKRVYEAAKILSESPLYVEVMPDFSLQDVEDTIKRNIRDHEVTFIIHDYIHTSLKILEEITRKAGGVKLREDNVLFMLSTRLKDICNQYEVFIESATQLNGTYQESDTPDQNLLRGAKSIAD